MLHDSCNSLAGVSSITAAKLAKSNIITIFDLLLHIPYKYQDKTKITPICDIYPNNWYVIVGNIHNIEIKYGKKNMLYCTVTDKTGFIRLRFFHFNKHQIQAMHRCNKIYVFGEVSSFNNQLEMIHPEYQLINNENNYLKQETLTPIYTTTQGMQQNRIRKIVQIALKTYDQELNQLEWMTKKQLQEHNFYNIGQAIKLLHNPPPNTSLNTIETGTHPALQRLAFDELLAQRLSQHIAKKAYQKLSAPPLPLEKKLKNIFLMTLPFTLTKAQERVAGEISQDLTQSRPMLRLVQGDVGSGKTVIAALAALQAIAHGYQVAFMAPTDLLAEQHEKNLSNWLGPIGINVLRISKSIKGNVRKKNIASLSDKSCQLVIGTHALFQEKIIFAQLGLVIIDEQHRFGVAQRLLLQKKGHFEESIPHQLLMTATPIPRTLSMTHFSHLDISTIDELPPGRTPITTAIMNQDKRALIIERLQNAIEQKRQVYWVCTLIEESDKLQSIAAITTAKNLQEQLTKARVGLVHGRMNDLEKEKIMLAFKSKDLDLLVATTVIEVGVDVPNASLMIIENAERLGLAQLHQLRGRIGRGATASHCLLLYQSPLSYCSIERLKIMRETTDGFIISEKDLKLRGAGELLGTRQTGYKQFKFANIQRDHRLLPLLNVFGRQLIQQEPQTASCIIQRWLGLVTQFLQG